MTFITDVISINIIVFFIVARMINVLFNVSVNDDNFNAQSLNARDIALRLHSDRFTSTLFLGWNQKLDPRLKEKKNIKIMHMPRRGGSLMQLREMLLGNYDAIVYPAQNPRVASLFWKLKPLARKRLTVEPIEVSFEQAHKLPSRQSKTLFQSIHKSDVTIPITDAIRNDFINNLGISGPTIPVGVDTSFFKFVDRRGHQPPCKVIFVGTIQERKRPHLILEIAANNLDKQIEFHLIGGPNSDAAVNYMKKLMAMKERQNLKNVFFHGPKSQIEIRDMMTQSDIFILPSRFEGLPKVTLEAAATGLPCIVFADYNTPSVIDGVTGFVVSTEEEMAMRLKLLISNIEQRLTMGVAGARHVQSYDWVNIAHLWEQMLENEFLKKA